MTSPLDGDPEGPYAAGVRPLVEADLEWVLDLQLRRRRTLAVDAPRFWRPAPDAEQRQRAGLARMLADPDTLTVRTDRGYLVGTAGARHRLVDDLDTADAAWQSDGVALLQHARALGPVRLVAPVRETARREAAESIGMRVVATWWHHDLPLVQVRDEAGRIELSAPGATGRLVDAPPAYDPGGPILLVTALETAAGLGAIEAAAAERGATVAVATQRPDHLDTEMLLVQAGFVPTAVFLEG